jgi:hypothetical protein
MATTWYINTDSNGAKSYTEDGSVWVPDDMGNRHRRELQERIDAGEIILAPWVPPPLTPVALDLPKAVGNLAAAALVIAASEGVVFAPDLAAKLTALATHAG